MNDGFRCTIDRRENLFYWVLTIGGEQYEGPRGAPTMALAADDADVFRKQLDLSRHFKLERERQKREESSRSN